LTTNNNLTLGSLFDGIGVFPLAGTRFGIDPVWASEIEKGPISITKRHFPKMEHIGDITKLDGGKIRPVHIITFGSPCQNLSLAGNREGLAGSKSGLYYQALRIIGEMREATGGTLPIIAIWENVMGAFSSNDRMDFRAVLESFAGTEIPMPATGRWTNSGMVRGGSPDIAWRLMDARYWGRPRLQQRRRRIFLVADFGGRRSAEILFRPGDVFADTAPCGDGGLPSTGGDRISSEKAGRGIPIIHAFQSRRMRAHAKDKDRTRFISSFGKPTDPFPTLLARSTGVFAIWYGNDHQNGLIRYLTPTECERLMGLPEGWTAIGCNGTPIADSVRYKALGNAIALPCAEYIMAGIAETLNK
jgi:DNA (cytosine-5)-methyltransferase 1